MFYQLDILSCFFFFFDCISLINDIFIALTVAGAKGPFSDKLLQKQRIKLFAAIPSYFLFNSLSLSVVLSLFSVSLSLFAFSMFFHSFSHALLSLQCSHSFHFALCFSQVQAIENLSVMFLQSPFIAPTFRAPRYLADLRVNG